MHKSRVISACTRWRSRREIAMKTNGYSDNFINITKVLFILHHNFSILTYCLPLLLLLLLPSLSIMQNFNIEMMMCSLFSVSSTTVLSTLSDLLPPSLCNVALFHCPDAHHQMHRSSPHFIPINNTMMHLAALSVKYFSEPPTVTEYFSSGWRKLQETMHPPDKRSIIQKLYKNYVTFIVSHNFLHFSDVNVEDFLIYFYVY